MGRIVKNYLMYDHIAASLYRKMIVETDGKKYRLRVSPRHISPCSTRYWIFLFCPLSFSGLRPIQLPAR